MNKFNISLLVLIVAVIVIGISVVLFFNQPSEPSPTIPIEIKGEESGTLEEVNVENIEPEVITSEIDTSNWQTYRNEDFGFEFKYPDDWKEIENLGKKIISLIPSEKNNTEEYIGDIWLFIRERSADQSIESVYNGILGPELYKSATGGYYQILLENKKVIYFKKVMGLMPADVVVITLNSQFIEIYSIESQEILMALVNTFKFIE